MWNEAVPQECIGGQIEVNLKQSGCHKQLTAVLPFRLMGVMRRFAPLVLLLAACATTSAPPRANVRVVTDEADAVLAILDARAAGRAIGEAEWQRVFASEGYVRLKAREHAMNRAFDDDAFREFVMSPEVLARRATLHDALQRMKRANLDGAANCALAYLPANATIDAVIYPVIKPRENSFVFDRNAIFIYLTEQPVERFEETVAHELHHIGYGTACVAASDDSLPPPQQAMRKWLGAFGEGFAVLAASGGLRGNPYASAEPDVREAWRTGTANYAAEFARVERFFTDVLNEKITGDEIGTRAFELYGLVGPWYTVGWKMAVTIEEELGREELVRALCRTETLLATYNRAADAHEKRTGERLPRWSERLTSLR